jgi:hypothetical protein
MMNTLTASKSHEDLSQSEKLSIRDSQKRPVYLGHFPLIYDDYGELIEMWCIWTLCFLAFLWAVYNKSLEPRISIQDVAVVLVLTATWIVRMYTEGQSKLAKKISRKNFMSIGEIDKQGQRATAASVAIKRNRLINIRNSDQRFFSYAITADIIFFGTVALVAVFGCIIGIGFACLVIFLFKKRLIKNTFVEIRKSVELKECYSDITNALKEWDEFGIWLVEQETPFLSPKKLVEFYTKYTESKELASISQIKTDVK